MLLILGLAAIAVFVVLTLGENIAPDESSATFEYGIVVEQTGAGTADYKAGDTVELEIKALVPPNDPDAPGSAETVITFDTGVLEFEDITAADGVLMIENTDTQPGTVAADFVKQGEGSFIGDENNRVVLAVLRFTVRSDQNPAVAVSVSAESRIGNEPISTANAAIEFPVILSGTVPVCGNNQCDTGEGFTCPRDCAPSPTPSQTVVVTATPVQSAACQKAGINFATIVPIGENYINKARNLKLGYTLELAMNPGQLDVTEASFRRTMQSGMTPILRVCYPGAECGFSNVSTYVQFINALADRLAGDGTFFVIAGPNEPLGENWLGNTEGDPVSTAAVITPYMNAVISGVNKDNVKLLSPAFNITHPEFENLVAAMTQRGARFSELDGIAGNGYNLEGYSLGGTITELIGRVRNTSLGQYDFYLTETGTYDSEKNPLWTGVKLPHEQAKQKFAQEITKLKADAKIKAFLFFDSFASNPDPNFVYNFFSDEEIKAMIGSDCYGGAPTTTVTPSLTVTPSQTATATPSMSVTPTPVCQYFSTQARVQKDSADPWKQNTLIQCGQTFNVGSFHNGTDQFAADTILTVSDPSGALKLYSNGDSVPTQLEGRYTLRVTTRGQSGAACFASAYVECSNQPVVTQCTYQNTQARVHKDVTQDWVPSMKLACGETFEVGSFHNGTGQFAQDTLITVRTPDGTTANYKNGDKVTTDTAGRYDVIVTTEGQTGPSCTDSAYAVCTPENVICADPLPCPTGTVLRPGTMDPNGCQQYYCAPQPTPTPSQRPCPTMPVCKPGEILLHGDPVPGSGLCPAYFCVPASNTLTCESGSFTEDFSDPLLDTQLFREEGKGRTTLEDGVAIISLDVDTFTNHVTHLRKTLSGNFSLSVEVLDVNTNQQNGATGELGIQSPAGHAHINVENRGGGTKIIETNVRVGDSWLGSRTVDVSSVTEKITLTIERVNSTLTMYYRIGEGQRMTLARYSGYYFGDVQAQLYSFSKGTFPPSQAVFDNLTFACPSGQNTTPTLTPRPTIVVCSQDVMQCPDGTYVSREARLNCAFKPCNPVPAYCGNKICEAGEAGPGGSCPTDCQSVRPTPTPTPSVIVTGVSSPVPSQSTAPTPTITGDPICTGYSYTDWSECIDGKRVRTVISTVPASCTGGPAPVTKQICGDGDLVCPQDMKTCPDGSLVARDPNNGCQFQACPGEKADCVEVPDCANPAEPGAPVCQIDGSVNWCPGECVPVPSCAYDDNPCAYAQPGVIYCEKVDDNETPAGNACAADYDRNGTVTARDFGVFALNYKKDSIDCSLDITGDDCRLDINDFRLLGLVYEKELYCPVP
ncbi:MAG: hypothetical protein TR69_WS6001000189 [candidate division WS6 bacterium OLB20]|uniref:Uncharacterized protein n=1 Tax=candidate division WS6 bacterium OLB20 TaxID=1617426 RepID=A0A136M086_9BACT|nr:MAG: hypothetical protein TR69_WS6001000189 [candidate division WS6 bacterium OLB20]